MTQLAVTILVLSFLFSIQAVANAGTPAQNTSRQRTVQVTVDTNRVEGPISPDLMGFNIVYALEKDKYWQDSLLPSALRELSPGFLRFPAGTAVSYWQWDNPTGRFKVDGWNPRFDGVRAAESEWMSLEEYMGHVQQIGAKPLIGINISSGHIYKRVEESVNSAIALVKHNLENGYGVKHYYLDNEQYVQDQEPQRMPVEQYAYYVNLYADAMRRIDPDIKIVANWVYNSKRMAELDILFDIAGHNIDYLDLHEYWAFSNASFERWAGPRAMTRWDGLTYDLLIRRVREKISQRGLDIEIGFFEWNIGAGNGTNFPSPYQSGLIISEHFMQMIRGGLDVSTFWPLHWPASGKAAVWQPRTLVRNSALENAQVAPQPVYEVFRLYRNVLGQLLVHSETNDPGTFALAALNEIGQTVTLCILNKVDSAATVQLHLGDLAVHSAPAVIQVQAYSAPEGDLMSATAHITELPWELIPDTNTIAFTLPPYSFAKVKVPVSPGSQP